MALDSELYWQQIETMVRKSDVKWEKLFSKSVLITGAAGMLGSGCVDALIYLNEHRDANVQIYLLARNEEKLSRRFGKYYEKKYIHTVIVDVSKDFSLPDGIDYIIHAASNANPKMFAEYPVDTLLANVIGLNNLMKYVVGQRNARLLYVSSGEMYGQPDGSLDKGFYEDYCGTVDYSSPRSCYPAGKRAAEVLCQSYISQYNVEAVVVRPCHCYGPTMTKTDNRAISQFIWKGINKEDIVLKSDGSLVRTHCYVVDAVEAMFLVLLNAPNGEAYNIADNQSDASIRELAEIIVSKSGTKLVFDLPNESEKMGFSKVTRAVLDGEKLKKLGWNPRTHLEDGIAATMEILA